jgi:zinc protease
MKYKVLFVAFSCLSIVLFAQTQPSKYPSVDIPYKKFVLDNGLRLIVHEDHKAPIVGVNVWYHVGSKNEKPGKTGFAHLFEHLMFNGSENYNYDYFKAMEAIGATDLNGTTNEDRTNYFQNVPVSALDRTLWLESDRMGHLVNAIDTAKINEQRGVVQNEKRSGENQPYAIAWELTTKNTYPAGHPYSWTVIGSMEDLNAASLDDVKEWFKTYYGPNNAVIVIAGDIDPQAAYDKVKKYFGDIPPGPPIAKHDAWVAKMKENHRQTAQDRVAQARLQKTWNVPQWGTPTTAYFQLLSNILTNGKSSRLYKRLVYDEQIASRVSSYLDNREISGQFYLEADAKPGVPLSKIETAMKQELKKIMAEGVTATELERAKIQYFAGFLRGLERIGGFGGKSDVLAQNEVYGGTPDFYKQFNEWIKSARIDDIKKTAQDWLSEGEYALEIIPYPTLNAVPSIVDRKKMPDLDKDPEVKFPRVNQFSLSNNMQVLLVQRSNLPVLTMEVLMDGGYASDQFGKPGLATLAMKMLREGTKSKSAIQISNELADLGASINSFADLDENIVRMNALKSNFDKSVDLFADILINPVFPQKDFERLKQEQLLAIKQEETEPFQMGFRILPKLIYGEGHAYSTPFTGSGTEEGVKDIQRSDLIKYHQSWFAPNNATIIVVGDVSELELKKKLEAKFAGWTKKEIPKKNIANVTLPDKPKVFIMDKPDAIQSVIMAAQISPSGTIADWINVDMMNKILGGEFTSRINMNLREDKHWSYGSGSFLANAQGPGMFISFAPVQTDKTKESIVELKKELEQYIKDKPATAEEFSKVQKNAVMQLPGGWETNMAVQQALEEQVKYKRGNDYWNSYAERLRNMTLQQVNDAARNVMKPSQMVWLIVGDRNKIEKGIRELKLGEIHFIDAEGKERILIKGL